MEQAESHHDSYQRLLHAPVIRSMRVMASRLALHSKRLGLFTDARQLKRIDDHLTWLLGQKAGAFDFVGQVARGKTLLVGEGNLSFTLSLTDMDRIVPSRLTATTFETEKELSNTTQANAKELRAAGVTVLHGIDATDLADTFGSQRFDTIVFQFPNAGSRDSVEGHTANFVLVRDFLTSAAKQLAYGGQVLISAIDSPYYEGSFQFEEAAEEAGFLPPKAYAFDPEQFSDYEHTMTHQDGSALDDDDQFSTWVFSLE